ncbi:unnamed protein product [Phytophthora fragariaefolia]|uniref:Unnamed protein product n=1 Tax=Phytophthora fragariaefolia TaxID=1490495 RepID=A0A9W6U3H3_9STRA|nr:unnamed protein product [Phytophthora fragariaefolia]
MYKASSRYYLTADESLPYRTCPNKRYIGKVMFLAAIARPRKIYVQMLKDKVFPAIRKKWPGRKTRVIRVQQDNAGPHFEEDHGEVIAAGQERGWKIKMVCQPPRSPMCNILDLGIFNCIQSAQYRQPTNQIDGLIDAVQTAFNSIKYQTIEKCFLTLQKVMACIIIDEGGNNFKLPRVGKLISGHGEFPTSLTTTSTVVENGYKALTSQILNQ